jgi:hypothetical protein
MQRGDSALKKVLTELNSLDLYPTFVKHHISTEHHAMSLDITRLNLMGVTIGRGDQFLNKIKQQKQELLKQGLETINSSDLYDTLADKDILAKQLITLDDGELQKLGLGYFRRRKFLDETKKFVKSVAGTI